MLEQLDRTVFYRTVWLIVQQIPPGRVATYGQIASMIPPPPHIDPEAYRRLAPRVVGDAMNAVSGRDDPAIPWHRVINSRGGISLPVESAAANIQRQRLRAEQVTFDMKERVDLHRFGWDGPDSAWLQAHDLLPPQPIKGDPPAETSQLSLF
jgi:methylated-DNA-protein-cysteine methyltransferase-like protein